MIIIIDGYNLLKQITDTVEVSDQERNRFLAMLGRYAQRKNHKLIVVFDAGPFEWVHREKHSGVRVVYSGHHETADDYIIHYLHEHQNSDLLLVTSDHELLLVSSQLRITSIGSLDFYYLVQQALHDEEIESAVLTDHVRKITKQEIPELDELMRQATAHVPIKEDDAVRVAKERAQSKLSKKDRKLMAKLKKL